MKHMVTSDDLEEVYAIDFKNCLQFIFRNILCSRTQVESQVFCIVLNLPWLYLSRFNLHLYFSLSQTWALVLLNTVLTKS